MSYVDLAKGFAYAAHAGQYRRDGKTPYIRHSMDVASRVASDDEKAVAWLHDCIEDSENQTFTRNALIELHLPYLVYDAVELLTRETPFEYEPYIHALSESPLACAVKIADMESNLADTPTDAQRIKYAKWLPVLRAKLESFNANRKA